MASVRYIVADVDKAVAFYRDNLDFKIDKHNPGKFAALLSDDLTLYLSAPGAGSGGQAGGNPKPGGWLGWCWRTRRRGSARKTRRLTRACMCCLSSALWC